MTEVIDYRPLAAVLVSLLATVFIVASYRRPNLREAWTILAAVTKFGLIASMVPGVLSGTVYVSPIASFLPGISLALQADPLGLLFAMLASLLWIVTSFYSIGYMRGLDEHAQTRYFASFAVSVSAAVGVAMASNLLALFVFYELLTVATYPLVGHDETDESRAAGRKYLAYTFAGGVSVLAGTVGVYLLTGTVTFTPGGIEGLSAVDTNVARALFGLLIAGFGVKAALMPVHSWLPDAMVAPTPVSGLLHAVAVVKSGVFGIARVVLEVFGPDTVSALGVGVVLAAVAAFTLTVASVMALRQDNLKRRLAYSTVSQLSYIVLGLGIGVSAGGTNALIGGLLHIPAHAFMKLTLFFCAGILHVETHTDAISDMAGIGKRMPLTMSAFAVAAAGMAGIPLVAGFVSKWYLLLGSVGAGGAVFAVVLLISGVLNIAYFWPIVYTAFFESPDDSDTKPLLSGPFGGRFALATDGGKFTLVTDGGNPVDVEDEDDEDDEDDEAAELEDVDAGVPVDDAEELEEALEDVDIENADADTPEEYLQDSPGEYAVDRYPSDHMTGNSGDEEAAAGDAAGEVGRAGDDAASDHHDDAGDHHDDGHHHGPPPGGWTESNWRGGESTWFMLGPILAAATGSLVLGVVPHTAVFLRIVELIVANATGVAV
ncbi:cation:proton antiporter [Haloparvum sp. PAK95]|uniref:cation:proton antiporter n=1 Tax=Haloparvum sp. PAK95 TaxID=3418962 RepID=UPI003D2F2854